MKTVFVVGAGASTDFGLPLGSKLVTDIRELLTSDIDSPSLEGPIRCAMNSGVPGDYGLAAKDIAGGMIAARSIDRFLDSRSDRPITILTGKVAIAHCLLESESQSAMGGILSHSWESIQNGLVRCKDSWLAKTFSLRQEGIRPANSEKVFDNIGFITFNYDRCIEKYIRLSFEQIMGLNHVDSNEIASQIPIIHIYGSLGSVDFNCEKMIPFGASKDRSLESSNLIRTFTEGTSEGIISHDRDLLGKAEQIIFLGFAFDPMNVEALFGDTLLNGPKIYATCSGVSDIEKESFSKKIFGEITWRNNLCFDFCESLLFRSICQR